MEQLDYNLLFRGFVGLGLDDVVSDRSVFSLNRDQPLSTDMAREFFGRVFYLAEWKCSISGDHVSGQTRINKTHASITDPESGLLKKGEFTEAQLGYITRPWLRTAMA